jgi:hypothetical protein
MQNAVSGTKSCLHLCVPCVMPAKKSIVSLMLNIFLNDGPDPVHLPALQTTGTPPDMRIVYLTHPGEIVILANRNSDCAIVLWRVEMSPEGMRAHFVRSVMMELQGTETALVFQDVDGEGMYLLAAWSGEWSQPQYVVRTLDMGTRSELCLAWLELNDCGSGNKHLLSATMLYVFLARVAAEGIGFLRHRILVHPQDSFPAEAFLAGVAKHMSACVNLLMRRGLVRLATQLRAEVERNGFETCIEEQGGEVHVDVLKARVKRAVSLGHLMNPV